MTTTTRTGSCHCGRIDGNHLVAIPVHPVDGKSF